MSEERFIGEVFKWVMIIILSIFILVIGWQRGLGIIRRFTAPTTGPDYVIQIKDVQYSPRTQHWQSEHWNFTALDQKGNAVQGCSKLMLSPGMVWNMSRMVLCD